MTLVPVNTALLMVRPAVKLATAPIKNCAQPTKSITIINKWVKKS